MMEMILDPVAMMIGKVNNKIDSNSKPHINTRFKMSLTTETIGWDY
jgi:hypothetical protein